MNNLSVCGSRRECESNLDLFPQVLGRVRALDGLDVEVADSIVLTDRRVSRVREWTGALVTQTRDVVLIPRV